MSIQMTREALLDKLGSQLAIAEAYDAEQLKAHQPKEREMLATFRQMAKDAAKWDYATLKSNGFSVHIDWRERPRCPDSIARPIRSVIRQVEMDSRQRFTLSDSKSNNWVYRWVTWTPEPAESLDVC